jgi:transcriptional regulator with XRE-family HTH domain
MESLNERLARLRQATGLTQREVARALGIKSPSVAQWESGRSRPDLERLPALARLYKVTIEELCGPDFPAAQQQGRLDLLEAYDTLDEEGRTTLLNVARSLADQAKSKRGSVSPKPAEEACVTPLAAVRGRRR